MCYKTLDASWMKFPICPHQLTVFFARSSSPSRPPFTPFSTPPTASPPSSSSNSRREPGGEKKGKENISLKRMATYRSVFDAAELRAQFNAAGINTKFMASIWNGAFVEAVIMTYDTRLGKYGGKPRLGGPRSTLCISSQVGCKMGCKFCATGTMGFKNNLTSGEIVEQLVHASLLTNIRNVVFMGMGEPLNNYTALVEAIRVMTGSPFQLSPKRITVSTVGIIHAINKLHGDLPGLNLAVSLHAPVQEIRCQIMPSARAFPLEKLMTALQTYQKNSQQKIFIEYIMLDGMNDEEQHAHQLGKLLETFQVVVNLIPFNPIGSSSQFRTSSDQKVSDFQKILRGTYNIRTTVRKQMGQDISGACGQLVVNLPDKRTRENTSLLTDIEDLRI
ncbi:hypothetical protein GOBAR_AA16949 [Gossypium barbadense]|uniref:Radical SAM core domain-containing protein n=2 Tax=Gossypium TaxID=3633 RepID=A0A2P5XK60_GOSBA|nr:hypothetical protein GOBAR_AA16949 [Gossypium barbadense]